MDDFDDVPEAKSWRSTRAVRRPRAAASRATPASGDPAADDEDVEALGAQSLEGLGPVEGASEGRGANHGASLPQAAFASSQPFRHRQPRSALVACQRGHIDNDCQ